MLDADYQEFINCAPNILGDVIHKLSAPLVACKTQEFEDSKYRLAFIGQETLEWNAKHKSEGIKKERFCLKDWMDCPDAVSQLARNYMKFDFAEKCSNKSSPFWRAQREILKLLGEDYRACLWTNLFKVSALRQNGGSASIIKSLNENQMQSVLRWQGNLLSREIAAAECKVVWFATGPSYDSVIEAAFDNVKFEKIENEFNFGAREFARLCHPELPKLTFRTYHPRYLQTKSCKMAAFLAKLIREKTNDHRH